MPNRTSTDLPTRAISIRQPWAWAILNAGKRIENRGANWSFRGPICIHAAKGMTQREYDEFKALTQTLQRRGHIAPDLQVPHMAALDRGGIVGVATITRCITTSTDPWFFGPFGLVLENIRPVPFIPSKGQLGVFKWEPLAPDPAPHQQMPLL